MIINKEVLVIYKINKQKRKKERKKKHNESLLVSRKCVVSGSMCPLQMQIKSNGSVQHTL